MKISFLNILKLITLITALFLSFSLSSQSIREFENLLLNRDFETLDAVLKLNFFTKTKEVKNLPSGDEYIIYQSEYKKSNRYGLIDYSEISYRFEILDQSDKYYISISESQTTFFEKIKTETYLEGNKKMKKWCTDYLNDFTWCNLRGSSGLKYFYYDSDTCKKGFQKPTLDSVSRVIEQLSTKSFNDEIVFMNSDQNQSGEFSRAIIKRDKIIASWAEKFNIFTVYTHEIPKIISDDIKEVEIPLIRRGNMFYVKIYFDNLEKIYLLDSGASEISIDESTLSLLWGKGVVDKNSELPSSQYILADGSKVQYRRFKIPELTVGRLLLKDLDVYVVKDQQPLLLGKSFLNRFSSWKIDNNKNTLTLTK